MCLNATTLELDGWMDGWEGKERVKGRTVCHELEEGWMDGVEWSGICEDKVWRRKETKKGSHQPECDVGYGR